MFESRMGKILVIIYALFSILTYLAAFACGSDSCGLYIVLPIMPWAFIVAADFGISFPWAMYPVFVLLNASVAYVVGAGTEWLYHRYQDRHEESIA